MALELLKTLYFQDNTPKTLSKIIQCNHFHIPSFTRGLYYSLLSTHMVVFLPLLTKIFTTKVHVFNFHGLNVLVVSKPLICCTGTRRIIQSFSHCCFNSIHSSRNMVTRLAHASHACTMTISNFTRFFHNSQKFMIYLVYSLRLSTFSFENSLFTSR